MATDRDLEDFWREEETLHTVAGRLGRDVDQSWPPFPCGAGNLFLLPGDLRLALREAEFAEAWMGTGDHSRSSQIALRGMLLQAAQQIDAAWILLDLGPNLPAINRTALSSADYVILTTGAQFDSKQNLQIARRQLREWQIAATIPGYVIGNYSAREGSAWLADIRSGFRSGTDEASGVSGRDPESDPYCLGALRHNPTLAGLAAKARKPMFELRPADGAMGALAEATFDSRREYSSFADRVANACGVAIGA